MLQKLVDFFLAINKKRCILKTVIIGQGGHEAVIMSARIVRSTRLTVIEIFGGYCYGLCESIENRQKPPTII